MIERIDRDVNGLARFFSVVVLQISWSLVMLSGILAMMYLEHAVIGLSFTGFSIVALIVMYRLRNFSTSYLERER